MWWFMACAQTAPPVADCPPCEACGECNPVLEPWEQDLLGPQIAEIREGVRPFDDDAFGVCAGVTECETFLGRSPEELPAGDHMIRGELAVPSVGEGWSARFRVDCAVVTKAGRETTVDHENTYTLVHTGPKRGYLLQPLWRIQSPHPQGSRDCTYTLFSVRPDGTETEAASGRYRTAMPEE